ncbi:MAG: inorganic phosphate transporter family protein [Verrucomicrobia bacterium]|nr:inorganic phosphate transporter family protein [Verrucomicrobiota bacterium]
MVRFVEIFIILIVLLGLLFDYTNGFHDAANVVSTVIATGVLAPISAIVMAGVLNFIGATQISGVAETIATGLVQAQEASQLAILSALIGAIFWNFLTWYYGIPSSSSYALIGGLIGAAWVHEGATTVIWSGVIYKVILPMFISPIVGFLIAYGLMKGLYYYLNQRQAGHGEGIFRHLQIGSACFVALSHGLNDAQKSMGIITLGLFAGGYLHTPHIPLWVILTCAVVMGLGTASGGFRIIRSMGFAITKLEPVQGFAAELSASAVILTASFLGIPVSSTQMIAGSITGVGTAKSLQAVSWKVPQKFLYTWVLTLPGAGIVGALVYFMSAWIGSLW